MSQYPELDAQYRQHLSPFIRKTFELVDPGTKYYNNWHIECIAAHLEEVEKGNIRRLIINMPPRSLKSMATSIAFPAWLLGRNPSNKVIVGSYAQALATKHSVDTRLVITSDWYKDLFPATTISVDQNEKQKFQTTLRGHRISCSVGSGITGEGGDFLIVDDPHNPAEALSDVQRLEAITWFDQSFVSRLNDKRTGRIVLVMQRLHTNDLTGHLLEKGGWHHLCLPAIAQEENQEVSLVKDSGETRTWHYQGLYLHADRQDKEVLDQIRNETGAYAFAGQYMQTPAPEGGGEFKQEWLMFYEKPPSPREMNLYILVDPANEKKKNSDYTAMVVIGLAPDNNYYLLDIVRDKFNSTERIKNLITLHKKWNQATRRPPIVGYEKYGMMTDSHYIKIAQEQINYRFPIIDLGGTMKKEDRIRQLQPLFEAKRFYMPLSLSYTDYSGKPKDLIRILVHEEMLSFPVGIHPDIMDSMARICDKDLNANFPRIKETFNHTIMVGSRFHPDTTLKSTNPDFLNW